MSAISIQEDNSEQICNRDNNKQLSIFGIKRDIDIESSDNDDVLSLERQQIQQFEFSENSKSDSSQNSNSFITPSEFILALG